MQKERNFQILEEQNIPNNSNGGLFTCRQKASYLVIGRTFFARYKPLQSDWYPQSYGRDLIDRLINGH